MLREVNAELGQDHASVIVMDALVRKRRTINYMCSQMHYERRTIRRYKEKYITCAAVKAAAAGLLEGYV